MSYTLRGRIESRLAASLVPFLVAGALAGVLHEWWPLKLAGLMIAVGLALDLGAYHRLLPYQPGWLALPLGLLELGLVMAVAVAVGLAAPLVPAVALFTGSWLLAQVLAHAGFPLLHLSYAEDGGELGRAGGALLSAAPLALVAVLGAGWISQPPTVRLEAGVHQGPLVLDRPQRLVGGPGVVVRGGILITSDDVTVRDVRVVGGVNGIEVQNAEHVVLESVRITGSEHDAINARRSSITVRDCTIVLVGTRFTQAIDISFAFDLDPSVVEGCSVLGGQEGIVSHMAHVSFRNNSVQATTMRGIVVTEMSMGEVKRNTVTSTTGVGIFCSDFSVCRIEDNHVVDTRPDPETDDRWRDGLGIIAHFGARATLKDNVVRASPGGVQAVADARIDFDT